MKTMRKTNIQQQPEHAPNKYHFEFTGEAKIYMTKNMSKRGVNDDKSGRQKSAFI